MFPFRYNKKKKEKNQVTPVDLYLDHLNKIFQQEPLFFKNESEIEGLPGVTSIVYKDIPEPGFITGLTYGLSLVNHPAWKFSRPELCITVNSNDIIWGQVAGYVANRLRGSCPFTYGETIDFKEKISLDSEMGAFFVFAPSILDRSDFSNIDIGADYKITISGLYPMYRDELEAFTQIGLEKFWHHPHFDLYNVNRKHISVK